MDKYAIYLRKSRADVELENLGEGETLAKHKHILNELAKRKNYYIEKTYQEIVSGDAIETRPQMKELLQDILRNKYKGVLVVEIERLARGDAKDQSIILDAFKNTNTLIVTPSKVYDPRNEIDEEYFEFGLFMSRREYKTIKRRLQQGRLESVKAGNYISGYIPLGYEKIKPNKKDCTLLIVEHEAEVVKLIFDLWTKDKLSLRKIAAELTRKNILTPTGLTVWNKGSVQTILKNVVYKGYVSWNKFPLKTHVDSLGNAKKTRFEQTENVILAKGKHKAIIPEEQFDYAQTLFSTTPPVRASLMLKNPLTGLLYCARCGSVLNRCSLKNSKPRYRHLKKDCKIKSCACDEMLMALYDELLHVVEDYEIDIEQNKNNNELKQYRKSLNTLNRELEKHKNKRSRLFDLFEDGTYTKKEFIERKQINEIKITELENDIKDLESNQPTKQDVKKKVRMYSDAIKLLKNDSISADKVNLFLKQFIERIDCDVEDLGRKKGCNIKLSITFI